jgi:hypothetical protein
MDSQLAGREVRVQVAGPSHSFSRRTAAAAGALFLLAIVVGIPEAQRRVALLIQSAVNPTSSILPVLIAFGVFLVLYGVPAIWLLHGGTRFRGLALAGPFLTLGSFVVTIFARAEAGGPRPGGIEVGEVVAFTAASVVLLTGRPSRARLRAGTGIACLWLLLSVIRLLVSLR